MNPKKCSDCQTLKIENYIHPKRIGVVEWAQVKRHGRILYIRLKDLNIQVYDIRQGDKLKVKLHSIIKESREKTGGKTHEEKTE